MKLRLCCCAIALSLTTWSLAFAESVDPHVQIAIEQKAVSQRRRITTAQLELTRSFAVREATSGQLRDLKSAIKSFSRTKLVVDRNRDAERFDTTTNSVQVIGPNGTRLVPENKDGTVERRYVLTATDFILRDATLYKDQGPNTVRTGPRSEAKAIEPHFFRVEFLGLIPMPSGLLYRTSVEAFYGVPERSECQIEELEFDGLITLKSSYVRKDGKRVAFWFVPDRDNSVVQTEFSMTFPDGRVRKQVVHSKLENYDGIWFPAECEYSCWSDEKLIENELWEVKSPVFNAPIDESVFTLAGMDLPLNTLVLAIHSKPEVKQSTPEVHQSKPELKTWDGKQLIETTSSPGPVKKLDAPQKRGHFWLVVVNVLAGLFFLALYFCKRRATAATANTRKVEGSAS